MATAVLNPTYLQFKDENDAQQTAFTSTATHVAFAGPAGAARVLRGVAAPTHSDAASTKAYTDTADAIEAAARVAASAVAATATAAVASDLVTEQNARAAADTSAAAATAAVAADLVTEEAARAAADTAATTARGVITAAATAEATTRAAADAALTSSLATESAARTAADTAEASARATADTANASAIASEISDRAAAVTAEAGTRASADTANAAAIAGEIGDRTAAVTAEASARASADTAEAAARAAAITAASVADRAHAQGLVDGISSGVHWKASCRVLSDANTAATWAADAFTATANGACTIDGIAMAQGDRVLLTKEVAKKYQGVYRVTNPGSAGTPFVLTRSTDADSDTDYAGMATFIREGTYSDQAWIMTTDSPTLNTDDLEFSVFSTIGEFSAGTGVSISEKVISIAAGGVVEAMLNDDAVTADKLAANAVGAAALADDAVDTAALQDDACTDAKCNFTHVQASQATFSGVVQAASYTATSDARAKDDIRDLNPEHSTEAVRAMRCCSYRLKSDIAVKRCGTIAQDCLAHKRLEEFVREDKDGNYSVAYMDMIAMLCSSLQDAHRKIDELMAFATGDN